MAGGQDAAWRRGIGLTLRAYLAGPDVFLPQAGQWAEFKKAIAQAQVTGDIKWVFHKFEKEE